MLNRRWTCLIVGGALLARLAPAFLEPSAADQLALARQVAGRRTTDR
ncbi:hypothetical protein [Microbispora bryophytorum]|nr:hypothetical protein [Microbispora bryophytorum]MBD3140182.1 hypothetical protein [Microbispora bryophytorum]